MKRFVKGLKNSQRIRVLIKESVNGNDFGVYTTIKEVVEGNLFVRELHRSLTVETLQHLADSRKTSGCTGIVWGFYDAQVQIDLV